MKKYIYLPYFLVAFLSLVGCAHQEESRIIAIQKVESAGQSYNGKHTPISVGKFDNRSSFMRGVVNICAHHGGGC